MHLSGLLNSLFSVLLVLQTTTPVAYCDLIVRPENAAVLDTSTVDVVLNCTSNITNHNRHLDWWFKSTTVSHETRIAPNCRGETPYQTFSYSPGDCSLVLQPLLITPAQAGTYTCSSDVEAPASAQLTVFVPPSEGRIVILGLMRGNQVILNTELTCDAPCSPICTYSWKREDSNETIYGPILTLVEAGNDLEYTCTVTNNEGSASREIDLYVLKLEETLVTSVNGVTHNGTDVSAIHYSELSCSSWTCQQSNCTYKWEDPNNQTTYQSSITLKQVGDDLPYTCTITLQYDRVSQIASRNINVDVKGVDAGGTIGNGKIIGTLVTTGVFVLLTTEFLSI